jgi:O-antigen ligase
MLMNYLSVVLLFLIILRRRFGLSPAAFTLSLVLLLIPAIFTVSIGLGALPLALAAYLFIEFRHRSAAFARAVVIVGVLAAGVMLVISPIALQRHATADRTFDLPVVQVEIMPSSRLMVWEQAFDTFLNDPILGKGLGEPVAAVVFQNTDGTLSLLTDAHNTFLSVAAQTGVVGLAGLIFLCVSVLRGSRLSISGLQSVEDPVPWIGMAFFCAFVYQGMTGSFEDARHLWFLIGMIPAAAHLFGDRDTIVE